MTTDSPRPAGRRWGGRWRRNGVLARGVLLVRGVRRSRRTSPLVVAPHPSPVTPLPPHSSAASPRDVRTAYAAPTTWPDPALTRPVSPAPAGPASAAAALAPVAAPRLLPGEPTLARRVRFLLANGCTVGSLSLGVLAILLAMRGDVHTAAICLMACVAFDGLDGLLARRLGVSSPFGAQMDSLADMCSFGIAAPVVVYAWLAGAVPQAAAAVACTLVAACAAIRLARFNVCPRDGRFFSGVPTTMAAAVLSLLVLIDLPLSAPAQLLGVALLAFAMVSGFPYATLDRLVRLPLWLWLVPVAGALVNPQLTFAVVVVAYLASGPLLWLHQRRTA